MSDIITILHPENDENTNLYPNIKKENIPNHSIDRSKISEELNSLLDTITELKPSGTGSSNEILAFTEDKGIYVATSGTLNGHWFYWNGNQYADGGVYQAISLSGNNAKNIIEFNKVISKDTTNSLSGYYNGSSVVTHSSYYYILINCKNYKEISYNVLQAISIPPVWGIKNGVSQSFPTSAGTHVVNIENYDEIYVNFFGDSYVVDYNLISKNIITNVLKYFSNQDYQNYMDLDNAPNNSIITYVSANGVSHLPVSQAGTLLTINGFNDSGNENIGKTQIYMVASNGDVYVRIAWGSQAYFIGWQKLAKTENKYHLYDDYVKNNYNFTTGKKAVFFGDSITKGTGGVTAYPTALCNKYGVTCYNESSAASCFCPNNGNTIQTQVNASTHKADSDFIFVAGGTNDYGFDKDLTTFKSRVNDVIDTLLTEYTNNQKIIFITPISRLDMNGNNSYGTLDDYINIITECCIEKDNGRISVIQGYKFDFPTLLNSSDFRNLMYQNDGLHPSQKGQDTAYLYGIIKALNL